MQRKSSFAYLSAMNVRENYMVSNLSSKQTYVGSIPAPTTLFFTCILFLFSLFTSCGLEPARAEITILGDFSGESRVDGEIPQLKMPLVDPYARDNKPEDVIRHFVTKFKGDEVADIIVVIGATPDEYDEVMGAFLSPNGNFYYNYYVNEMYYGEINSPHGIVFVPHGYKMFGYKFLPSRYDLAGKIIHLRRTTKYLVGEDGVYKPDGLEWKFTQY